MKRIFLIILISLQIFTLAACSNSIGAFKAENAGSTLDSVKEDTSNIPNSETGLAGIEDPGQYATQSGMFDIVAESGNSISSVDKEKVIKKLDDELGTLFDSINGLEEK